MDLNSGWQSLLGFAPAGLWNILAAVGVAIMVIALVGWLWKRRKGGAGGGGGGGGFPWIAFLLGATLAGPKIVVPAILLLAQGGLALVIKVVEWFGQQLQ